MVQKQRWVKPFLGLLVLTFFLSGGWAQAAPIQVCTYSEIAKLARGEFSDQEIQNFCFSDKKLPAGTHVKQQCVPSTIARLARGGFSDTEIQSFCLTPGENVPPMAQDSLAKLEGKKWQTSYFLTRNRKKKEDVTFVVAGGTVEIISSNPRVSYYDVKNLGDSIQFKRSQTPYRAIYTITIRLDQVKDRQLMILQKYKKASRHIWKAR